MTCLANCLWHDRGEASTPADFHAATFPDSHDDKVCSAATVSARVTIGFPCVDLRTGPAWPVLSSLRCRLQV